MFHLAGEHQSWRWGSPSSSLCDLCPATDKQEPTCWSQRRKPLGSLMVAKHLFPSEVWEKACTAIPQNHRAPRGFFSSSPYELGSPGDMQTFASGEAKVRHPFENFKPQTRLPGPLPCGVKQRECLVAAKPRYVFALKPY